MNSSQRHNWQIIENTAQNPDAPFVVLAHGFGTDHQAWHRILPWLRARYNVAVYDLAGAGRNGVASFDPLRHTGIDAYADDLIALLDEQNIGRCTIITHSVSGMVALLASLRRPGLFDRVIMISASPCYLNSYDYHGGFEQADLDGLFAAMAANYHEWAAGFAPGIVGGDFPDAVDEFTRGLRDMRPDIALQTASFIFLADVRAILPAITVPVVAIQPEQDPAVPVAVGEYLRTHIPDCKMEWINSIGHMPHMTHPAEIIRCLEKHFGEPVTPSS
ncbi:MAG: alpha/beta hydrolase [Pseudomonadota bacterium]